jgi:L-lactate dehydrogenase complex protein LldE
VVPSGSCAAMIGHHFSGLFANDEARLQQTEALSKRVFEFSQFLTLVAKVEDVGAKLERVVTYHDSCHALRELHIKDGPRRLLRNVRGLELREMDAAQECCGFGGTFSVKFAQLSTAMAQTKLDSIARTGASTVVSIDSSCLMQLSGVMERQRMPVTTMHLAEVLASR